MVERADSDGDGLVTLEDFYNIMTKKTFAWKINIYIFIYNLKIFNLFKKFYYIKKNQSLIYK